MGTILVRSKRKRREREREKERKRERRGSCLTVPCLFRAFPFAFTSNAALRDRTVRHFITQIYPSLEYFFPFSVFSFSSKSGNSTREMKFFFYPLEFDIAFMIF